MTFLSSFFGRGDPFRSVRAIICERNYTEPAESAERGSSKLWGRKKVVAETSAEGSQRISEKMLFVWIAGPSRTRVEERSREDSHAEPTVTVVDGDAWTTRDEQGHVQSGDGNRRKGPSLTDVERHFDANLIREFFNEVSLEARSAVRTASRDCIRLHTVLRPGASLWPHWLPKDADEYEFHADCQRGVLLALSSSYKGSVFWCSEVTEVHFDEAMADELFTYTPRLGEQIHPPVPVVERLSVEAAIKQLPFTVFVPSRRPGFEQSCLEFMYHPARLNSPRPHLSILFHGESGKFLSITEAANEDPELQDFEWENLCQDGQEFRLSDPGRGRGVRIVVLRK